MSWIAGSHFSRPFQKKRLLEVHVPVPFSCEKSNKSSISYEILDLLVQGYAILSQMATIVVILAKLRTGPLSRITFQLGWPSKSRVLISMNTSTNPMFRGVNLFSLWRRGSTFRRGVASFFPTFLWDFTPF